MTGEETANNKSTMACPGLHVVFGSRTRRGLSHPNEDRHAVATWQNWNLEAHTREEPEIDPGDAYPKPELVAPICTGSARKDTTVSGCGGTGALKDPQVALGLHLGQKVVLADQDPTKQAAYLWTVCDGHDGPEAADYVCQSVGEVFSRIWHKSVSYKMPANYLKDKALAPGEDPQTFARGYSLSNALARTYEVLDQNFKQLVCPDTPALGSGSTTVPSTEHATAGAGGGSGSGYGSSVVGSTAGSCVTSIFLSGNLLCCAGLGDCKAAILTLEDADSPAASLEMGSGSQQQFQVTWFSKEHRSSAPKERARIRARGGWFRHGRVGGVLEPTRTIGDFDVKASQPAGVLIATPEVRTFNVTKPAMILVASDGVWDVMDASQLLRTLKKRRRLWRGVLSWLGAPVPERRSLMNFGFRKRAKSKEGLSGILQLPTGGDLVAMAEALVTRAHDLGSDDDCTCVCIYLRPAQQVPPPVPGEGLGESGLGSKRESDEEADSDDEDEEEEDEEEEETAAVPPATEHDSSYEYEKWRRPEPPGDDNELDADNLDEPTEKEKETDEWKLATNVFPVSAADKNVDEEAPEIVEKARRRREERRAARERRRRSLEERP
ncbi:protein phosphatase 2C [Gregarina niphandrodes]|uniref:Protein phosphatase 2C n=1 Tax=Gregarina niphandrodes TaxID=110365 RepID=A0A023BDG2_GRENI|nr:protein phosphatase 2C [Gregarina niphandrodes]EZG88172.1 protein phosphatase 2C [Gregarina niphandrodes]|eukprot:XP_011128596.1 protein phosphatase 2C [Gregarina niphandrodes]